MTRAWLGSWSLTTGSVAVSSNMSQHTPDPTMTQTLAPIAVSAQITFASTARTGACGGEGLSTGVSGLLGACAGCGAASSCTADTVATGVTCNPNTAALNGRSALSTNDNAVKQTN